MRILAFDTSSPISAVALVADGQVLAEDDAPSEAKHGEVLLPRIQAVLARASLELAQLDLIGVGIGPGSFTGLRVGLATAKGLALAASLPIVGVNSLRVLARGAAALPTAGADCTVLTLLDAFRGEVFGAVYRANGRGGFEERLAPFHAPPDVALERVGQAARGALICGDGLLRYGDVLGAGAIDGGRLAGGACDRPQGRHVAFEALECFAREGASNLATLEPAYLRGSDAKLPDEPLET